KKNELSSEKNTLIVEFETELDEIFCFCDEFKTPAKKNELSSEKYTLIVEFETEVDEIFCFCDEFKTPAVMACRTMSPTKRSSSNTGSIQPFTRQTRRRSSEVDEANLDAFAWLPNIKERMGFVLRTWNVKKKNELSSENYTLIVEFETELDDIFCFCDEFKTPAKKNELSSKKYALIMEFETELDEIFCFCDEFKTPA
ncbi:hypothetical protein ACJX0J_015754, partial [Zea mays]